MSKKKLTRVIVGQVDDNGEIRTQGMPNDDSYFYAGDIVSACGHQIALHFGPTSGRNWFSRVDGRWLSGPFTNYCDFVILPDQLERIKRGDFDLVPHPDAPAEEPPSVLDRAVALKGATGGPRIS